MFTRWLLLAAISANHAHAMDTCMGLFAKYAEAHGAWGQVVSRTAGQLPADFFERRAKSLLGSAQTAYPTPKHPHAIGNALLQSAVGDRTRQELRYLDAQRATRRGREDELDSLSNGERFASVAIAPPGAAIPKDLWKRMPVVALVKDGMPLGAGSEDHVTATMLYESGKGVEDINADRVVWLAYPSDRLLQTVTTSALANGHRDAVTHEFLPADFAAQSDRLPYVLSTVLEAKPGRMSFDARLAQGSAQRADGKWVHVKPQRENP